MEFNDNAQTATSGEKPNLRTVDKSTAHSNSEDNNSDTPAGSRDDANNACVRALDTKAKGIKYSIRPDIPANTNSSRHANRARYEFIATSSDEEMENEIDVNLPKLLDDHRRPQSRRIMDDHVIHCYGRPMLSKEDMDRESAKDGIALRLRHIYAARRNRDNNNFDAPAGAIDGASNIRDGTLDIKADATKHDTRSDIPAYTKSSRHANRAKYEFIGSSGDEEMEDEIEVNFHPDLKTPQGSGKPKFGEPMLPEGYECHLTVGRPRMHASEEDVDRDSAEEIARLVKNPIR